VSITYPIEQHTSGGREVEMSQNLQSVSAHDYEYVHYYLSLYDSGWYRKKKEEREENGAWWYDDGVVLVVKKLPEAYKMWKSNGELKLVVSNGRGSTKDGWWLWEGIFSREQKVKWRRRLLNSFFSFSTHHITSHWILHYIWYLDIDYKRAYK